MTAGRRNVVTGAFGYTGRYIARRLLSMGEQVTTLTTRSELDSPFGKSVAVRPLSFDDPDTLTQSLAGAEVLYNTYWVRFPRGETTFERAVVRPALVFGDGDILVNNIAWAVRRFPVFPVFGSGLYKLRPVFVDDVAAVAVDSGHRTDNLVIDAVGPDTLTFEELVRLVAERVGSRAKLVHLRPGIAHFLSRIVGYLVRDHVLTRDEVAGLMDGLLVSDGPATGQRRLSDWLEQNRDTVGKAYVSELRRNYR